MALYTVGHSTFTEQDFAKILDGKVDLVADVRSHPESRWPWFEKSKMQDWLPSFGFGYEWFAALGGWDKRHLKFAESMAEHGVDVAAYAKGKFPKQRISKNLPTSPDASQLNLPHVRPEWTNIGLRDYSFYMTLPEFMEGCDRLVQRGEKENIVYLCCECTWWRCHRSMISDYLLFRGVDSYHLMPHIRQKDGVKFIDGSKMTPHSKHIGNRLERYEPSIIDTWKSWCPR